MDRFNNGRLYSDQVRRPKVQRKWNNNVTAPSVSSSSTSTSPDLRRIEGMMESIAKSLGVLTGRLDAIEKGPPSRSEPAPNAGQDTARPAPMAARSHWSAQGGQGYRPRVATPAARSLPAPGPSTAAPLLPTPAGQPTAPSPSANPDFSTICKALHRTVLIRRQMTNWTTLPASIDRNLKHVASNIRPVHPSDQLNQDISDLFNRTGLELRDRVQRHFTERLDSNLTTLRHSQPLDKDRAVEVVTRQLGFRLGSKVTAPAIRLLVEEEGKVIGRPDLDTFSKPGPKSSKRPCLSKSPSSVSFVTPNPFSALAPVEGDDDEEDDSPSPPRKPTRGPSTDTPSHPSTPRTAVSFKPPTTASSSAMASKLPSPVPSAVTVPHSVCSSSSSSSSAPITFSSASSSATITTASTSSSSSASSNSSSSSLTKPSTSSSSSAPTAPPGPVPSTSSSVLRPRYTRHSPLDKTSWKVNLRPDTRALIVSDSNFKFIGNSDMPPTMQLDCFSGANLINALPVIKGLPSGQLDYLVVSIGINHKDEHFATRTAPAVIEFLDFCRLKAKEVIAVGISINPHFPQPIKDTLTQINRALRGYNKPARFYIPPLPDHEIYTERDLVHYTRDTQAHILSNIIDHVGNMTKN